MKNLLRREKDYLLAGALFFSAFLVIMNYIWVVQDIAPPWWDQAYYLLCSEQFYRALVDKGLFGLLQIIRNLGGVRAPLISLLPLPFYTLLGNGELSAMFVNFSFLLLLSYFLFKLVCRISNPRAAFISVLVVQTMPLFYTYSREFLVEYGMATLTVIYCYALIKSDFFENKKWNVTLGVLLGLGLLLKTMFVMYVALPTAWSVYLRHKHKEDVFTWRFFGEVMKMLLLAGMLASLWYTPKTMNAAVHFGLANAFGPLGEYYNRPVGGYIRHIVFDELSTYYFFLGLVSFALSFSLAKRARGEGTMAASISRENMIFLGLWFLPIMVCVFAKDKDARFLLPMMVVPGIVVGISVEIVLGALLKQKGFIKYCLIVIALLLFPVSAMVFQSFLSPRHAPDKNDWKINEIVKYMHKEVRASRADDPSFVISLKSHHALNGNTLRYYCAINKFEDTLRFTRWELGQRDINKAVAYIGKTKPSFLIWPAGHLNTGAPNICNVLAEDLHRLLIEGRLPYSLDKVFPLDHGVNIMLYKRKPERLTGQG